MTKTRLTIALRCKLISIASDGLDLSKEQAACDKTYPAAAKTAKIHIHKRWPPFDMEVLKRYECASKCDYVYVQQEGDPGTRVHFAFRKDDDIPLSPGHNNSLVLSATDMKLFNAYVDSMLAMEETKKARMVDYKALINGVGSLEEIEVVWPEASQVRRSMLGGAVSVLNPDVIERIRQDVAAKKRKKK